MAMDSASFIDWQVGKKQLIINCPSQLNIHSVTQLWQAAFAAIEKYHPHELIVDAQAVDYCDSAGISFLLELKNQQQKHKRQFSLQNLNPNFQQLFEKIEAIPVKPKQQDVIKLSFIASIGKWAEEWCVSWYHDLIFLGELSCEIMNVIRKPQLIRWKDMWRAVEITGPNALPIVVLLGFLVGLIISFQSAIPLQRFGAVSYIPNIVGISLTRELGPLMVAIILAGRTASAFAAEIGTMKVNQEIDALKTFGLRPLVFLAIPRILAVTLMTPLLSVFMNAMGLVGCAVFMMSNHYAFDVFYKQVSAAVTASDLWGGLFKSLIFGLLIAAIGCKHGLRTRLGASAVGDSTTHAVVSCIIMIVIVDGIFAIVYYILGI